MWDHRKPVGSLGMALATMMLAAACAAGVLVVYGGGNWAKAAQSETSTLSAAEVSELVGTTAYQRQQQQGTTLVAVAAKALRLPMSNPLRMLTSELPGVQSNTIGSSPVQGSLVNSLAHWKSSVHHVKLGWLPNESTQASIQTIQANPGINVVSPGWLELWSPTGIVKNYTNEQVVTYAHQHGIKVWAMFDNQYSQTLSHQMLHNAKARLLAVRTISQAVVKGHLDGVNVDFENLDPADQAAFTSFVKELHSALAPDGAKVSVDITPDIVPLQDNAAYFHAGLAASADYVVVMAYDEHWGGDSVPGPVADVPWVTKAVNDLLDTGVGANQVILGMPSYTRFWHVYSDGSVTSEAVADSTVAGILAAHHTSGTWNSGLGLFYARYPAAGGYEEVWYSGPQTWAAKLRLVTQDGLAGVAVWSLSLSNAHTWSTVVHALGQSLS